MHPRRLRLCGALVLALLAPAVPVSAVAESVTESATESVVPSAAPATAMVTLVTGDRVALSGRDKVIRLPAKGRERITFSITRTGDHVYVVPSDAQRLVASGRLDRRLFDVAGLLRQGYGDDRPGSIPLIVSYAGSRRSALPGARVARGLPAIGGAQVSVAKDRAAAFFEQVPALGKVWLDGKRKLSLDGSVPLVGAPAAWRAGYTGKGVRVAVLDTGVDAGHPDLAGRVAEAKDFTGAAGPDDTHGHGTHVASTVAGTGERYRGVAPDATLISGKVCGDAFCDESAILAGMEWAATEQHARVVNLSLGGTDTPEVDPLEQAINTLTERTGALFVVAAGNEEVIESPGSADAALTVGATDKQDVLADFSGRGPRISDGGLKPDVTAPGVAVVAARAAGTSMGSPVSEHYTTASGTSMATPHVVGAAALLAQRHPDWKAPELKAALMGSAKTVAGSAYEVGAGRLDAARAIGQSVIATTPSVSFGVQQWPHHDDKPDARQLTYRNAGDQDVELALTTELTGPDGRPAPDSALTLGLRRLRVPAGGTASVTVTSDTRVAGADGNYSGWVTATAGDTRMVTPVGVVREAESYDLTVRHLDREGNPTAASDLISGMDVERFEEVFVADGVTRLRLPKGRYVLVARIDEADRYNLLVQPTVSLDRDVTVTADARTTKPMRVEVERDSAGLMFYDVGFVRECTGCGWFAFGLGGRDLDRLRSAQIGSAAPPDEFTASLVTQWGEPGPQHDFTNSPYLYGVLSYQKGSFYTGHEARVRDAELAKVTTTLAAQQPGRQGSFAMLGSSPVGGTSSGEGISYDLSRTVTRYLSANGSRWTGSFSEVDADGMPLNWLTSEHQTYRAGRPHTDRWNGAVFGPSFSNSSWAVRDTDSIRTGISLFGDAAGHADLQGEVDTASTKLFRNGQLVAESDRPGLLRATGLPDERAEYRLTATASRDSKFALSTRVDAAWSFRSGGADEGELPLWAVRFQPRLDASNTGSPRLVPITVQAQPGATVAQLDRLTVAVSGDDGVTWLPAKAVRTGKNSWLARVAVPAGSAYVSFRAKAADSRGNTVEQTVIRAYRLGQTFPR